MDILLGGTEVFFYLPKEELLMSTICRADTVKLAQSSGFFPCPSCVMPLETWELKRRRAPSQGAPLPPWPVLPAVGRVGLSPPAQEGVPQPFAELLASLLSDFSSSTRSSEWHRPCQRRQTETFVNYSYIFPWKSCSMLARHLLDSQASQRLARTHEPRNMTSMPNMNEFTPDSAY